VAALILPDLSSAFDTVDHHILTVLGIVFLFVTRPLTGSALNLQSVPNLLHNNQWTVGPEVTSRLALSFVTSQFDHSVLAGLPQSTLAPLQHVQNVPFD
jgi:hypothetical protein